MSPIKISHNRKIVLLRPLVILLSFLSLILLSACVPRASIKLARDYQEKSEVYYKEAIKQYQRLIQEKHNSDALYFELAQLYYNHGEFELATEALKNTSDSRAAKYLGICYYRLGNFTDSLEVLGKNKENADDECLYYYALSSEKLNLFDQALEALQGIKSRDLGILARGHIANIKKDTSSLRIKDINPQTANLLDNNLSLKEYPQAGALILYCDERIEITSQGTQVSDLHYLVKVLNQRGKEEFAEAQVEYDSTYEKVELEYARTIKPDGTVVDVGRRHIRDVSKYLNFPLYSNVRAYIISFPGVVEGASIEYKIKIRRNQLINKNDFVLSYPVQTSEPIMRADFKVIVPKDKKLHIKVLNPQYNNCGLKLTPDLEDSGSSLIYSWQFKNIPQILPESNMPPSAEIIPAIVVSTFKDWQDIYRWWWDLAKDKIRADNAISEEVKRLTSGIASEEGRARAIYNFCAQKIRYVGVEYGQAGYEPHKAEDIFKNKYGDCKDQAMLLVAMLKEAGCLAWPVLISTKEYYDLDEQFPAVLFNHCIVALSLNGNLVFLDPTAETCSFGDLPSADQGRKILLFKEDGYQIKQIPLYPARHNLLRQSLAIKIGEDESIDAKKSVVSGGIYEQAQRSMLLYTPPELIVEMLREKIQDISIGAKLADYDIKNAENLDKPVVLNYAFSGPEYLTKAGRLRILPGLASLDTSLVAKDKRKYPIDLGLLDFKENIFEIEIPEIFVIKYIPESVNQNSPWLKYSAEYSYANNRIYLTQKIELKKNTISIKEYQSFKYFFESLAKKLKQRVVLERIN